MLKTICNKHTWSWSSCGGGCRGGGGRSCRRVGGALGVAHWYASGNEGLVPQVRSLVTVDAEVVVVGAVDLNPAKKEKGDKTKSNFK